MQTKQNKKWMFTLIKAARDVTTALSCILNLRLLSLSPQIISNRLPQIAENLGIAINPTILKELQNYKGNWLNLSGKFKLLRNLLKQIIVKNNDKLFKIAMMCYYYFFYLLFCLFFLFFFKLSLFFTNNTL